MMSQMMVSMRSECRTPRVAGTDAGRSSSDRMPARKASARSWLRVGDGVRYPNDLRFECQVVVEGCQEVAAWLRVQQDALPDFPGQVEAAPIPLDALHYIEALAAVPEAVRENPVELVFADVAEWGMTQIVAERNGFGEVFVEVKCPRYGAGDLADFERVCQAGYIVVAKRRDEDLRLVLEPAERLGVEDAVAVALELGADIRWWFGDGASG